MLVELKELIVHDVAQLTEIVKTDKAHKRSSVLEVSVVENVTNGLYETWGTTLLMMYLSLHMQRTKVEIHISNITNDGIHAV